MQGSESTKRLRKFLDDNREEYQAIAAKLEDPVRLRALLFEIYGYLQPVLQINAESPPHAAMFAVGQIQGGIEEPFRALAFYEDYRARRAQLENLIHDESVSGQEHSADLDGTVAASVT